MGSDIQPGTEMEIIVEETITVRDVSNFTFLGGAGRGLRVFGMGNSGNLC